MSDNPAGPRFSRLFPRRATLAMGRADQLQNGKVKLLQGKEARTEDLSAIVVTVLQGTSYDKLFSKVRQENSDGEVLVYQISPGATLRRVHETLEGVPLTGEPDHDETAFLADFKRACDHVGAEAVCFNFECCSGFAHSFGTHQHVHMEFLAFLVKEFGCMVMFSDFSLKSLIKAWDVDLLGPNPFAQVDTFSGPLELEFNCNQLQSCPSIQLQTVGMLTDKGNGVGNATLTAMSNTIAFTITQEAHDAMTGNGPPLPYEVEVLTVAKMLCTKNYTGRLKGKVAVNDSQAICNVNNTSGLAGHVLLSFPPSQRNAEIGLQGRILASCGHWLELMKVDTNVMRLLEVAREEYGANSQAYREVYASVIDTEIDERERQSRVQTASAQMVQSRPLSMTISRSSRRPQRASFQPVTSEAVMGFVPGKRKKKKSK